MRCWQEPGVCDHAFVQSMNVAEDYVCDEHRTREEREKELFEQAKEDYCNVTEEGHLASSCIECKQCEGVCPQHLPITDLLKQGAEMFE